jgi:hypothetical protein
VLPVDPPRDGVRRFSYEIPHDALGTAFPPLWQLTETRAADSPNHFVIDIYDPEAGIRIAIELRVVNEASGDPETRCAALAASLSLPATDCVVQREGDVVLDVASGGGTPSHQVYDWRPDGARVDATGQPPITADQLTALVRDPVVTDPH